jgi:hypothetical protein
MYTVDQHDRVEELTDLPHQSTGAPVPLLLAEDGELILAYLVESVANEAAIVEFESVSAHYFGPPNDETLNGHPLYQKGCASIVLTRFRILPGFVRWSA